MRILVVIQIPVALLYIIFASIDYGGHADLIPVLAAFLTALAVIGLSVQAANTIVSSERVQQTLEVLADHAAQRARHRAAKGARAEPPRVGRSGAVADGLWHRIDWLESGMAVGSYRFEWTGGRLAYPVCGGVAGRDLPSARHVAFARDRTPRADAFRAIVTALVTLVLWCALPLILMAGIVTQGGYVGSDAQFIQSISLLSPLTVGIVNEAGNCMNFRGGSAPAGRSSFSMRCSTARSRCSSAATRSPMPTLAFALTAWSRKSEKRPQICTRMEHRCRESAALSSAFHPRSSAAGNDFRHIGFVSQSLFPEVRRQCPGSDRCSPACSSGSCS